jgi:8-oxo-dGTP pyrophosphatase MutT (NUDIX family)
MLYNIKEKLRFMLNERKENKFAGVLIKANDTNRVLLLLRSKLCSEPFHWAMVSGGINDDEEILEGLKREIVEEISINPDIIKFVKTELIEEIDGKKIDFTYYEGFTDNEFDVKLNDEHDEYNWFSVDELPEPLYPNLLFKIKKICQKKNI